MPTAINMALNSTHVSPSALKGDGTRINEEKNTQFRILSTRKKQILTQFTFQISIVNMKNHKRDKVES